MTHLGGGTRHRRKYPRPTYHRIKCNVCRHPDRAAIDEAFLFWESPGKLARNFGIRDRSSIYRHARATGLFSRRRKSLPCALESIIESAGRVTPNAAEILMAVKMYSQFNDHGQWIEPPKRREVQRVSSPAIVASQAPNQSPQCASRK